MKVIFSDEPKFQGSEQPSIFLVGPTPRNKEVPSWRPGAIELLEAGGFDGIVLVPEHKEGSVKFSYDDQVEWEYAGLHNCTVIACWVPRCMTTMPALTTNIEMGYWPGKKTS